MTQLQPLGDQAVLAYFDNEISALRFARLLRGNAPAWLVDVVQAYSSVAAFFDLDQVDTESATAEIRTFVAQLDELNESAGNATGSFHVIPCCYERALDLERVARHVGLSPESVVKAHLSTVYTVFAIGFCPGFPYLGYLSKELEGVPRLESPRLRVDAGSVGLTGRQTGIYTESRPGGWNVIGLCPLELVNVADAYFPLRTGDQVRFEGIDESEFLKLKGERL